MVRHHGGSGLEHHFPQPAPDSAGFGDSFHNIMVLKNLDNTFVLAFAVPMTLRLLDTQTTMVE